VITPENARPLRDVKTFVTTDLQKAIADRTAALRGDADRLKYIGAKLGKYEAALPLEKRAAYRTLPEAETRALRLQHSSFYVCGGEESYGYSAADFVRDKDANGSVVVFAEVAAYASRADSRSISCWTRSTRSMAFLRAKRLADLRRSARRRANPAARHLLCREPAGDGQWGGGDRHRNFATQIFHDIEGEEIPKEKMLMIDLADWRPDRGAPSGTEPKIKFYMYARRSPAAGARSPPPSWTRSRGA
jgi:phosphoglucomutase